MRLIDADILLKSFAESNHIKETASGLDVMEMLAIKEIIDNAPTLGYEDGIISVSDATRRAIELEEAYNNGWSDGFSDDENERPQGEWIMLTEPDGFTHSKCSNCNQFNDWGDVPFCPWCGAKMKGGAE